MPEVIVSIAIIGILTAIAIPVMSNIRRNSQAEVAGNIAARINGALSVHTQTGVPFVVNANNSSTADEATVMSMLTTRDEAIPGSPLLQGAGWPSTASSNSSTFRLRWDGRFFQVVPAGQAGLGLLIKL